MSVMFLMGGINAISPPKIGLVRCAPTALKGNPLDNGGSLLVHLGHGMRWVPKRMWREERTIESTLQKLPNPSATKASGLVGLLHFTGK